MKVTKVKVSSLQSNPNNPRVIKDDKFKKLVKSIKDFPAMLEIRPIVVNKDLIVLGGNMRLKAIQEAGIKEVSIIVADKLSEKEQREFIIKDNVGYGEWDFDILANEWDVEELDDWGLNVSIGTTDVNLDEFFEQKGIDEIENGKKIILEFTLEEFELVSTELLKHGKSYEEAVYKLLGL